MVGSLAGPLNTTPVITADVVESTNPASGMVSCTPEKAFWPILLSVVTLKFHGPEVAGPEVVALAVLVSNESGKVTSIPIATPVAGSSVMATGAEPNCWKLLHPPVAL